MNGHATDGRTVLSVVIPVLNEEDRIAACLAQFAGRGDIEVIVSDGGSTDTTAQAVSKAKGARWLDSGARGRGPQMNAGAKEATGDAILFLHADAVLPPDGVERILAALRRPDVVGGRFRLELSERTVAFRLIGYFSTLRSRVLGITYGDQGIFCRRSAFDSVGGFPDRRLFEDSEFCEALARAGRFVLLDAGIVSSTRRWRQWGVWRTVFWMWFLRLMYSCSVSDERLSRWYRAVR